jgi:hypothetical protein
MPACLGDGGERREADAEVTRPAAVPGIDLTGERERVGEKERERERAISGRRK